MPNIAAVKHVNVEGSLLDILRMEVIGKECVDLGRGTLVLKSENML